MARRAKLAFLFLVLSCASVEAQSLPAGVKKVASMGGITEYDYPNGLKVLLYPDQAQPKFTVNVTYLVGSRHEGYGESGMAHLLEHMDFIETRNGRKIKDEIAAQTGTGQHPSIGRTITKRLRPQKKTSSGRSASRPTVW